MLTIGAAREITGSLGFPAKMPSTSYGLPASRCLIGGDLMKVPGSVCHDCYAAKDLYKLPNVIQAQHKRLAGISHPLWTAAMVLILKNQHRNPTFRIDLGVVGIRHGQRYRMNVSGWHRWHDSGDLQGVWHLGKICEVARLTPSIKHWLATRETKMVIDYVESGGKVPDNLTIRISATMVDRKPPNSWPLTSSVHERAEPIGQACPAPMQNHECGKCRACWSKDVANVSYKKH